MIEPESSQAGPIPVASSAELLERSAKEHARNAVYAGAVSLSITGALAAVAPGPLQALALEAFEMAFIMAVAVPPLFLAGGHAMARFMRRG